jgi:hypothetical protein
MGSEWGFCLEDGVLTYKALIQSVLGFRAPVWYPLRTSLKHPVAPLQVVQNACLCAITGCHASTSGQHLHNECQMLQVQDHLDMQCSQFLLDTRQVDHPSHSITSGPPGPRPSRKSTLQHRFNKDIEQFVNDNGEIFPSDYKKASKQIHTNAVASALEKREVNPVLGIPALEVYPSVRTALRQLRGGQCKHLQTYKHKLDRNIDVNCPGCRLQPYSTAYLFSCSANPTQLPLLDLWARPREAAQFLVPLPPSLTYPLPRLLPELSPPCGGGGGGGGGRG